jgi:hypothetical protein
LTFTSDPGFGILLNSFDLVDYANFASGHTVRWEIWSGVPSSGSLLTSTTETISANSSRRIFANLGSESSIMTLRLVHLTGGGTDLAIDNVTFQAIPEPGSGIMGLLILAWTLRRQKTGRKIRKI